MDDAFFWLGLKPVVCCAVSNADGWSWGFGGTKT